MLRPGRLVFVLALGCESAGPVSPGSEGFDPLPKDIVYYEIMGQVGGLSLVKSDGSRATRLIDRGYSPAWSPDGRRVAFSDRVCDTDWYSYYTCVSGGIAVIDAETRGVVVLPGGALGEDPAWDPTGNLIAFARYTERGQRLFIMKSDGSEAEEIVTPGVAELFSPSWSPDGRRIAFQCAGSGALGLCIINRDGSGMVHLNIGHAAVSPAWSPDGSRIAFALLSGGHGTIAIISPEGGELTRITEGLGPAWSRDGRTLAFSRNNVGLFRIDVDGTNLRPLTSGIHNSPDWRP